MGKVEFQDKTLDCMLEELDECYAKMYDMAAGLKSCYDEGKNPVSDALGRIDMMLIGNLVKDYNTNLKYASWTINRRYGDLQEDGYFFVTRDKDGKHHFVDTRTSIELEDAGGEALF